MKTSVFSCAVLSLYLAVASASSFAEDANSWRQDGMSALAASKAIKPHGNRAKNVILFLGDGMGVSTVTAARIFEGQQQGRDGERNLLSFEKLPYLAMSKTYSAN